VTLEATVTFHESSRWLMPGGPWSGMQPSFGFAGNLVACRVESCDASDRCVRIETIVTLDPHYNLKPGARFSLNLGGAELAEGVVESVAFE
jgi:hypothetical protein